jgi:hypothetical protein
MFRAGLLALVAGVLTTSSVAAQTAVADFYKSKNVDVYIGFSVGGVYDVNARLLSRFMGRHIPGNPSLIPRQMTGAASLTMANWLYQGAPKDGSAIGTFARSIAFNPLIGQPAGAIEAAKFNWIGSTNEEVSICASRRESGVTTFDQVFKRELVVGSTGGSGDDDQLPRLMNGVLRRPTKNDRSSRSPWRGRSWHGRSLRRPARPSSGSRRCARPSTKRCATRNILRRPGGSAWRSRRCPASAFNRSSQTSIGQPAPRSARKLPRC